MKSATAQSTQVEFTYGDNNVNLAIKTQGQINPFVPGFFSALIFRMTCSSSSPNTTHCLVDSAVGQYLEQNHIHSVSSLSSHVFSAYHPIHGDVIIKIAQSKSKIQQLSNEIHVRKTLPDWACNPMIDFKQSSNWALAVVKEIKGQTLTDHLKAIALSQARSATQSKIDGWRHNVERQLSTLHRSGYVHGDVKPSNIIIDQSGNGWLIDFGQAIANKTPYEHNPLHGGSRYFATKNVLSRKGKASPIDDYFGLAVSIACHVQGAHPFQELPLNIAVERQVAPNLERLPARYALILQMAYART